MWSRVAKTLSDDKNILEHSASAQHGHVRAYGVGRRRSMCSAIFRVTVTHTVRAISERASRRHTRFPYSFNVRRSIRHVVDGWAAHPRPPTSMLIPNNTPGIASFSCQVEIYKNHSFFLGWWRAGICLHSLFLFKCIRLFWEIHTHPPPTARAISTERIYLTGWRWWFR